MQESFFSLSIFWSNGFLTVVLHDKCVKHQDGPKTWSNCTIFDSSHFKVGAFQSCICFRKKEEEEEGDDVFSLDSHFKRRLNLEVKSCLSSEWCRGKSPIRLICHSLFRNSSTMLGWFSSWCSQKLKDWFSVFLMLSSQSIQHGYVVMLHFLLAMFGLSFPEGKRHLQLHDC